MGTALSVKTFYDNYLKTADKAGLMANEWRVQFSGGGIDQVALDFYVDGVDLPNKELIELKKKYRGREFSAPAGFRYAGDLKFTVTMDTSMTIYKYFADIINAISPFPALGGTESNNATGNLAYGSMGEVTGGTWAAEWSPELTKNIIVNVGTTTKGGTYTIYGAFPTVISGVDFANGDPAVATYTVTLAYAYFDYVPLA